MNLEQQIKEYEEVKQKIEELEEHKKTLSSAILQEMQNKTLHIANYVVRKYSRLSIKLSLESARALDAIKMEEMVDKDKIKTLYENGQKVEGVSEIHYIRIFQQKHTLEPLPNLREEA